VTPAHRVWLQKPRAGITNSNSPMRKEREQISYRFEEIPAGGRVRIKTQSEETLKAVHNFLRFQIRDHETGDSTDVSLSIGLLLRFRCVGTCTDTLPVAITNVAKIREVRFCQESSRMRRSASSSNSLNLRRRFRRSARSRFCFSLETTS
jgi:hypothetical protein